MTDVSISERENPKMDWTQVALNGAPPCWAVLDGDYCGRAEWWGGHGSDHAYVSEDESLRTRAQELIAGVSHRKEALNGEGVFDVEELTEILANERKIAHAQQQRDEVDGLKGDINLLAVIERIYNNFDDPGYVRAVSKQVIAAWNRRA